MLKHECSEKKKSNENWPTITSPNEGEGGKVLLSQRKKLAHTEVVPLLPCHLAALMREAGARELTRFSASGRASQQRCYRHDKTSILKYGKGCHRQNKYFYFLFFQTSCLCGVEDVEVRSTQEEFYDQRQHVLPKERRSFLSLELFLCDWMTFLARTFLLFNKYSVEPTM